MDSWKWPYVALRIKHYIYRELIVLKQIVNARRFPTAEHVIIVDTMVFGNMNGNSGCGTVFSRDPETGENCFTGTIYEQFFIVFFITIKATI